MKSSINVFNSKERESAFLIFNFRFWMRVSSSCESTTRQRAKEIGSGVSIKVWNELQQSNIEIDSELYYKVIQAICQTSELPSAKSTTRSLAALARVFKFSKDGMVNPEITRLVRANMTASQFTQLTAKLQI